MKLSLSTNWRARLVDDGEAIAEKAAELGFEELELGYATTETQLLGIKRRIDLIPVGSLHAFCPVPISAPHAHPELYQLASLNRDEIEIARVHLVKCIETAADIGADAVVLHAGRASFNGLFDNLSSHQLSEILRAGHGNAKAVRYMKKLSLAIKRRNRHSIALLDNFRKTLDRIVPILEQHSVTLALENMPYLEGFPDENEMKALLDTFAGAPIKAWFDTGHHLVRMNHGWIRNKLPFKASALAGMHMNDVKDFSDDHLAPGEGNVDFAALGETAKQVKHIVFEPSSAVSEESLRCSLQYIRDLWRLTPCR